VENYYAAGYHGVAEIRLPDGRLATADLAENQAENRTDWQGFLSLRITTPCSTTPYCISPTASGVLYLTDEQVTFDRRLRSASVDAVTITLTTPGTGGGGGGLPPGGGLPRRTARTSSSP
jgi:hypothetical protein